MSDTKMQITRLRDGRIDVKAVNHRTTSIAEELSKQIAELTAKRVDDFNAIAAQNDKLNAAAETLAEVSRMLWRDDRDGSWKKEARALVDELLGKLQPEDPDIAEVKRHAETCEVCQNAEAAEPSPCPSCKSDDHASYDCPDRI